jgi:molybdopterin-guanine dinucleotide biosynthesis protein A
MKPVGFAVAGGRSRRMGRDKALLPWGDTDLLGYALARLSVLTDDVRVLAGPEPRYSGRGVAVETDPVADRGPMGGLLAALESARGRPALLLGVDLPLVPPGLLARLLVLAQDADAAVPVLPRGPEPLCAVYGAGCLEPVRHAVAGVDLKMTAFWGEVRVREVRAHELAPYGDPEELFLNVNGPEDYERARTLAHPR